MGLTLFNSSMVSRDIATILKKALITVILIKM